MVQDRDGVGAAAVDLGELLEGLIMGMLSVVVRYGVGPSGGQLHRGGLPWGSDSILPMPRYGRQMPVTQRHARSRGDVFMGAAGTRLTPCSTHEVTLGHV